MTDKSSFAGKYAIVTGSTQGLGEAIARLFVERGAVGIIICGRNVERGMTAAADLNSDTCQVHFVEADLANAEDCRSIVAAADQHFGAVHILVNAAGVSDGERFGIRRLNCGIGSWQSMSARPLS